MFARPIHIVHTDIDLLLSVPDATHAASPWCISFCPYLRSYGGDLHLEHAIALPLPLIARSVFVFLLSLACNTIFQGAQGLHWVVDRHFGRIVFDMWGIPRGHCGL